MSELTMITVGENQLYIIANKQAAALKYEAVNVSGADVKMSTVEDFAWSNFRDRLMSFPELEITEYLDLYCSCLADCRDECTCGYYAEPVDLSWLDVCPDNCICLDCDPLWAHQVTPLADPRTWQDDARAL